MGPGDFFLQAGNLSLQGVPLLRLLRQGLLRLGQYRGHGLQVAVQLPQLRLHFVGPDQEKIQIQLLQLRAQLQIDPGVLRVLLQRRQAAVQLLQDIVHPVQVFLRMGQLPVRLFLAGPELDDTGCFLKNQAPVLPFPGQDLVNPPLADDGIAFLADAGIPEKVDHVLQAADGAVQEILALPRPVNPPGHHNLRVIQGQGPVLVVEHQGHLAVAQRLPLLGAVKNNVLHAAAAKQFRALLPQHPAHSVADVAFPGSVGADDGGDPFVQQDLRPLGEGLESVKLQFL